MERFHANNKNFAKCTIVEDACFTPSENISAPADTVLVECRIAAVACELKKGILAGQFETILSFPYNNKEIAAREINLDISTGRGILVVCAAYLIFHLQGKDGKTITNNIKFMPAGVTGVFWGKER